MSGNDESSSDAERSLEDDEESSYEEKSESSEEEQALTAEDRLFQAVKHRNATKKAAAQQAIRDGANVNTARGAHWYDKTTPLIEASKRGYDQIICILLDAGANARWRRVYDGRSAISEACYNGHLSTVQLLINHDNGLLDMATGDGQTPLFHAIYGQRSDIDRFLLDFAFRQQYSNIVRFLLESGADAHHVTRNGDTALMSACQFDNLEIVQLLLNAGVDLEARDQWQDTALHIAARRGKIVVVRGLILQHNANMFAVDSDGRTPFDQACNYWTSENAAANPLLEIYGNKLTQDHGRLALHELLKVAKYSLYSFAEERSFHPPLNPLRILRPLGKLTLKHLLTLLHTLDPELFRSRGDNGKLPIHVACQTNAPVEVLALILERDPFVLHIADYTGALPIHLLCGTTAATEYASLRYLVEQGGVGTLAARDRQGLLPLHVLCGSTNSPLRAVQYLIQSFPGSVAAQTNAGEYPFMMAASAEPSSASLSVIYELVRANPGLVVPR